MSARDTSQPISQLEIKPVVWGKAQALNSCRQCVLFSVNYSFRPGRSIPADQRAVVISRRFTDCVADPELAVTGISTKNCR